MKISKLLIAGIGGGVAFFLLGWLLYGMLLMGFFEKNTLVSAMRPEGEMVWWALILGNLVMGIFLAYVFMQWASIKTLMGGLSGGAIIGAFLGVSMNLTYFGTSAMMTMTGHLVDMAVYTIMLAITGGVVGWLLGMGKE
jgi:hypothetical protein